MPSTTTDTIALAFRAAIEAVVPRIQEGSATRPWRFYEGDHVVRTDARWFRFDWDGEGDTPGGFFGPIEVDTTVTLSISVDYGGVPERRVKIVAVDDMHQLRDVLNRLKSTLTGLRNVELIGWDFAPVASPARLDRNQARVVLQYEVRYMKARG